MKNMLLMVLMAATFSVSMVQCSKTQQVEAKKSCKNTCSRSKKAQKKEASITYTEKIKNRWNAMCVSFDNAMQSVKERFKKRFLSQYYGNGLVMEEDDPNDDIPLSDEDMLGLDSNQNSILDSMN